MNDCEPVNLRRATCSEWIFLFEMDSGRTEGDAIEI